MTHDAAAAGSAGSWWAGALGLALALVAFPPPAGAQYSPNCERNGRRAFCAYTPAAGEPGPLQGRLDAGRLVFADHAVYGLARDEASCRDRGVQRICRAWIEAPPGSDRPLPATYLGTAYEGGYRHEYLAPGLRLRYTFLD
ncbi:MAG: hypothetical protein ACKO0M_12910 [Cyanobium sp.]